MCAACFSNDFSNLLEKINPRSIIFVCFLKNNPTACLCVEIEVLSSQSMRQACSRFQGAFLLGDQIIVKAAWLHSTRMFVMTDNMAVLGL